jgi:hypothetical protein
MISEYNRHRIVFHGGLRVLLPESVLFMLLLCAILNKFWDVLEQATTISSQVFFPKILYSQPRSHIKLALAVLIVSAVSWNMQINTQAAANLLF